MFSRLASDSPAAEERPGPIDRGCPHSQKSLAHGWFVSVWIKYDKVSKYKCGQCTYSVQGDSTTVTPVPERQFIAMWQSLQRGISVLSFQPCSIIGPLISCHVVLDEDAVSG